jgi:LAO/AO transport system kinase
VKTVATDGTGIPELAAAIRDYQAHLQRENLVLKRNIENWQARLVEMLRDAMLEKARHQLGDGEMAHYAAEVAEHKRDPYTLVEEIVQGRRR